MVVARLSMEEARSGSDGELGGARSWFCEFEKMFVKTVARGGSAAVPGSSI